MTRPSDAEGKPTRLLGSVPGTEYHRLIVRYPYQDDGDQASAYHQAAMRLASTYKGQPIDDTMLLPFLMLYRQAFELELKELLRFLVRSKCTYYDSSVPSRRELDKRLKEKIGHKLGMLLDEVKRYWAELDFPEQFPDDVERVIQDIASDDPSGTAFRYAGGLPNVQENVDFLDLVELLDDRYRMLEATYTYAYELFAAMPDPSDYY